MQFDYCEIEQNVEQDNLHLEVGCKFIDEPDELYVIQLTAQISGLISKPLLLFNGMDCRYEFKAEEAAAILAYVQEAVRETEYAAWFKGSLSLSNR